MKIITEPTVTVLAAPVFQDHPMYLLPDGGTSSERLIAHAGKGCYDSYGHDGRAINQHIGGLVSSGHGSVLEHSNVSLFIEGISRGCSHEVVRHRAGFAFSQRSTRYTNETEASIVLDPFYSDLYSKLGDADEAITMDEAALIHGFIRQCENAFTAYRLQVDWLMDLAPQQMPGVQRRKWCRGKARQLLPHALETRMTMTGNLRAWRWFLVQRSGEGAEAEIRRLAAVVMEKIYPIAPMVFQDLVDGSHEYEGFPVYTSAQAKV
jgi:thymidylate synthase (FAD)